jgi:hypothetical protein
MNKHTWNWVCWHTVGGSFQYGIYRHTGNQKYCSLLSEMEAKYFDSVEDCTEWTDNYQDTYTKEDNNGR